MTESQRPNTNPQRGGSANQGQGTSEGLIGQATEAARNVASGASDLAQSTYEQGSRYVRDGWGDSLPDVDQYRGAVSRPVQENPLVGIMVAGAPWSRARLATWWPTWFTAADISRTKVGAPLTPDRATIAEGAECEPSRLQDHRNDGCGRDGPEAVSKQTAVGRWPTALPPVIKLGANRLPSQSSKAILVAARSRTCDAPP